MPSSVPDLVTDDRDVLWADFLDRLLAWKRFLAIGLVVVWAAVALLFFGRGRAYECTATLVFPDLARVGITFPGEPPPRQVGIHFSEYRKLEQILSDASVIEARLGTLLDARERRALLADLDDHLTPMTTNPRQDVARMDKLDTIVGFGLAYETRPEERARAVVRTLGALARDAFVTLSAIEQAQHAIARTTTEIAELTVDRDTLTVKNASLQQVLKELESLRAAFPSAALPSTRQVVDIKDGGDRFLPPDIQLVGARSASTQHQHEIRVLDRRIQFAALKREFFQRVAARLDGEMKTKGAAVEGIPGMVREELAALRKKHGGTVDLGRVESAAEEMAVSLSSYETAVRWLQAPTLKPAPRLVPALKAGVAATLLMLAVALCGALWQSRRALPRRARAA
jgi:hypothetical protein